MPSRSQLEKLGKRLASGVTPQDREAFFDYRESFSNALETTEIALRETLAGLPVVRRLKTLDSTVLKLKRERTRLWTMQDIAGCRLVVPHIVAQNRAVESILTRLGNDRVKVDDLRQGAHSGYRAVHLIVTAADGLPVEIQVRTAIQDTWAQASEKLADIFGLDVKYGRGPEHVSQVLLTTANVGATLEQIDLAIDPYTKLVAEIQAELHEHDGDPDLPTLIAKLKEAEANVQATLAHRHEQELLWRSNLDKILTAVATYPPQSR